jgi:hypothetical protein
MPAVYPPVFVPATHRGDYPHMAERDRQVWNSFLKLHAHRFVAFAYDVALGGVSLGPEIPERDRLGWQYNTALKIDAVGLTTDSVWIIEVRPYATVSALGAALTYTLVARRDHVFALNHVPAIVTNGIQPDVRWTAQQLGVQVVTVPE